MEQTLKNIKKSFEEDISAIHSACELGNLKVKYLGKKSSLSLSLRKLKELSVDERSRLGGLVNDLKDFIKNTLEEKELLISEKELNERLSKEKIDVTEPGYAFSLGDLHPLTLVKNEICNIFIKMGFSVVDGPEVETDYYNFEALNMPAYHPARDTQDTFYTADGTLLRTQTSSVQVRIMEKNAPPIRMICPGKVFRADDVDATHSPVFHQLEGLVVDKDVTFSDLKGTLEFFIKELYGDNVSVRLRPHNFPYTEPSAELDVQCFNCKGKGCSVCKNEGYIELLGCGMVHPDVLRRCNIDPDIYSGFAFGVGIERVVMKKYGIDDMRLFYENDVRFLSQFVKS